MELERLLGARLLDRTTRRVTPTEAGLAYYERCVAILADVEETEIQVSRLHDEPKGVLKINAPMSFGTLYLGAAVAEFMARYPELSIELMLNDRFIDPLEEGVDVTVRIGALAEFKPHRAPPGARAARARASPDVPRTRTGTPARRHEELAAHRCLTYGHMAAVHRWHAHAAAPRPSTVPITSSLCSNNGDVLRDGGARRQRHHQSADLHRRPRHRRGQAGAGAAATPPTELGIYALYAPNRYLAAKTRVFIDFLVERFGEEPAWDAFRHAAGE